MKIPVVNLAEMEGEKRRQAMYQFHQVCRTWGFFWVENHGVDAALMEKVKQLVYSHYDKNLKQSFYSSELAQALGPATDASKVDWETTYFLQHEPETNIDKFSDHGDGFREVMDAYIPQMKRLAETLADLVSESLGLEKDRLRRSFAPPFVGTKVAVYPSCPQPELVMGLRGHSDAGGIILLLQDDAVPGLEFFKDGEWVAVDPNKEGRIFVNFGEQMEVLTNGAYRSMWHRVRAVPGGDRVSVATFYNPGGDAAICPAAELLYPGGYRFKDYLDYYFTTKFSEKGKRFQAIKEVVKN